MCGSSVNGVSSSNERDRDWFLKDKDTKLCYEIKESVKQYMCDVTYLQYSYKYNILVDLRQDNGNYMNKL